MKTGQGRVKAVRSLVDHDNDANVGDQADLRIWLRLMAIHKLVKNEIGRCLRDEFAATLPRFDLLSQLRRNPDGLRMVEISRRLMVTNGNTTAITDQLEAEGLVQRTVDPNNRSAFLIKATAQGKRAFDAMAKEHDQWLTGLFAGLSDKEKLTLLALLSKQAAHLSRGTHQPKQ